MYLGSPLSSLGLVLVKEGVFLVMFQTWIAWVTSKLCNYHKLALCCVKLYICWFGTQAAGLP